MRKIARSGNDDRLATLVVQAEESLQSSARDFHLSLVELYVSLIKTNGRPPKSYMQCDARIDELLEWCRMVRHVLPEPDEQDPLIQQYA